MSKDKKAWLDFNIFTKQFSKIDCPTTEHYLKVSEEYGELKQAFMDYSYKKSGLYSPFQHTIEYLEEELSKEALDMIQASITLAQHLIDIGVMKSEYIKRWNRKMKRRKIKYLGGNGNGKTDKDN